MLQSLNWPVFRADLTSQKANIIMAEIIGKLAAYGRKYDDGEGGILFITHWGAVQLCIQENEGVERYASILQKLKVESEGKISGCLLLGYTLEEEVEEDVPTDIGYELNY